VKVLVETLGDFSLLDVNGRQTIQAFRPTVADLTAFVERHRGTRLTVLETLADDASDESLALAKNEDEIYAAIEALPRPEKPAAKPAPAPKPKGK
jgi:hypothetical protein